MKITNTWIISLRRSKLFIQMWTPVDLTHKLHVTNSMTLFNSWFMTLCQPLIMGLAWTPLKTFLFGWTLLVTFLFLDGSRITWVPRTKSFWRKHSLPPSLVSHSGYGMLNTAVTPTQSRNFFSDLEILWMSLGPTSC